MKIKLLRSPIGQNSRIRGTVRALGFKKLYSVIEVKKTPSVEGMIKKISHMIQEVKS